MSTTTVELLESIKQYKNQINQVEEALKHTNSSNEQKSLENLKTDLYELLKLTEETLDEQQKAATRGGDGGDVDDDDPFANEMMLFMSEIKNETVTSNDKIINHRNNVEHDDNNIMDEKNNKFEIIKAKFTSMIGKKCSAPHTHSWGAKAYHNAMICGLDDLNEYDLTIGNVNDKDFEEKICLRILFTNPTHQEMLPCSYYLDGDCRFTADKCRFSHGELIPFGEIKEYKPPDFSIIEKVKSAVLAKQNDRIWYKGRIVSTNFNEKSCKIKLDQSNKEIICDFEDIFPIGQNDKQDNSISDDSDSSNSDDDNDYEQIERNRIMIERSLFNSTLQTQALGEWEKHTKGFGSRMMQKYGYIIGTGLGKDGEGIIDPIDAQVLPPGRSLDHCMELREQANGDKNLFSVEKKMKKKQKRQELISAKAYEREKKKIDVFSFINETIFSSSTTAGNSIISDKVSMGGPNKTPKSTNSLLQQNLKNHSSKNLNVAGLKIEEDIRRIEKEIKKLTESMSRHKKDSILYKNLNIQLNEKNLELINLKKSEKNVATEQLFRKDKSKLSIF